jgi:hypothetical protein
LSSVLEQLRLALSQAALKCIKRALVELLFQQSSLRETEALALELDSLNNAKKHGTLLSRQAGSRTRTPRQVQDHSGNSTIYIRDS